MLLAFHGRSGALTFLAIKSERGCSGIGPFSTIYGSGLPERFREKSERKKPTHLSRTRPESHEWSFA